MSNYIDYIKWRGDLPFSAVPFCEVDAMILSELVYIDMTGIINEDFTFNDRTCRDVCMSLLPKLNTSDPIGKKLYSVAEAAMSAKRFADIRMCGYAEDTDTRTHKQFAAVLYELGGDQYFVAYRGTDSSLVGWKENMDLAYFEEIPSQKAAVKYLNEVTKVFKGTFYAGGHSKGGNLAVYAAAFSYKRAAGKVKAVYNFDGPGFNGLVISKDRFKETEGKVHTFVPQNSLIGLLLKHQEPYTIIKSTKTNGLYEHQMDTWEVGPLEIVREKDFGSSGRILNENITEWIDSMTYDEKKQFIDVIYSLVDEFDEVEDLFSASNLYLILRKYSSLNEENKQKVSSVMESLASTVKGNIREYLHGKESSIKGRLGGIRDIFSRE